MSTVEERYTTMLVFYYPKVIFQTLLDCCVGYILYNYACEAKLILSDDTPIKTTTWKELKAYAMHGNYAEYKWYKSLDSNEKHIVASLVRAQGVQGNLLEL